MRLPVPSSKVSGVSVQQVSQPDSSSKMPFITQADNLIKTQVMLVRIQPLFKGDGNE